MSQLGKYLKQLRKQNDLTVRELGHQIGYTGSYVSQMETGARTVSIARLYRLISALNGNMSHALVLLAVDNGVPRQALTVSEISSNVRMVP